MRVKVKLTCNECGKKFSVSPRNPYPRCPKCHGVDWDVDFDYSLAKASLAEKFSEKDYPEVK